MSKALDPISLAIAKASWWHGEQKRKYTNEDYIVHPIEVMNFPSLLAQYPGFCVRLGFINRTFSGMGNTVV
jgi:hypothetical protein